MNKAPVLEDAVWVGFSAEEAAGPTAAELQELDAELEALLREASAEMPEVEADAEMSDALKKARKDAMEEDLVDSTRAYLRKLGRLAVPTLEQQADLAKRIETGVFAQERLDTLTATTAEPTQLMEDLAFLAQDGAQAKADMVEANLPLVAAWAKRRTGMGLDYLDLIQEGNIGLIRAVEKFDYTKGFAFSTYATWWIRNTIDRALGRADVVSKPEAVVQDVLRLNRAKAELAQKSPNGQVDRAALARAMRMRPDKLQELEEFGLRPVSLDMPMGNGTEGITPMGEFIKDKDPVDATNRTHDEARAEALERILATFPERQRTVVELLFGLAGNERTSEADIAKMLGVSAKVIGQDVAKAMQRFRHPIARVALSEYLTV